MFFFPSDIYYFILVVPAFILSLVAQILVKSTFKKYAKIPSMSGLTGSQAARSILDFNGLSQMKIQPTSGNLTDHFSSKEQCISLSESTFHASSVAAIGVAAHEVGHAVQYDSGYFPIQIRNAVIPITNIGSMLSWPVIAIGFFMGYRTLVDIGIMLFALVAVFQLITLPVEFNASARALRLLDDCGILNRQELSGARKVLNAAALTYVAALAVSLMSILRLVLLSRRRRW